MYSGFLLAGLLSLLFSSGGVFSQTGEIILTNYGSLVAVENSIEIPDPLYPIMSESSLSPNGMQVAFESLDRKIWIVNIDGTDPKPVTTGDAEDFEPSWSPNGDRIVFRRGQPDGHPLAGTGWDLYLVNTDGTNITQLTSFIGGELGPSWSPDGDLIAFNGNISESLDEIYTIEPKGGKLVQLTDFPGTGGATLPAWSPNGQQIAFRAGLSDEVGFDLYIMNRDGSGLFNVTNSPDLYSWPCWSPDGKRIAFTTLTNEQWGVYSIETDGSNKQRLFDGFFGCKAWFTTAIETAIRFVPWGQIKRTNGIQRRHKP